MDVYVTGNYPDWQQETMRLLERLHKEVRENRLWVVVIRLYLLLVNETSFFTLVKEIGLFIMVKERSLIYPGKGISIFIKVKEDYSSWHRAHAYYFR